MPTDEGDTAHPRVQSIARQAQHCDDLSHALPFALWQHHVEPAQQRQGKSAIPFAILDLASGECFTAYMLFPRITFPGVVGAGL